MPGKRKPAKLRRKGRSFVADVYRPDGTRTTISFGPPDSRTEGEIHAAFGKWLDLYNLYPHKVLAFSDPYKAFEQIVNPKTVVTIGQLLQKYGEAIRKQLPPLRDGRPNPALNRLDQVKKFLNPYCEWHVPDFGPEELYVVQKTMVEYRYFRTKANDEPVAYTRTGINRVINEIHAMWQWGVGREITTEAQRQRLKEVKPLRSGRTSAKDKPKRAPLTEEEFEQVVDHLTSVVADMLRIIWLTAMRPSEVCRMRAFDLIRDDPACWLYVPGRDVSLVGDHKTAHFQRIRAIPLTAKAQRIILRKITDFDSKEPIFGPADAVQELLERKFANRKTPLKYGNRAGTNRKEHPMIKPGKEYTAQTLNVAVRRACKRAGVERFTPYDLRRTAATRVRATLSKDDARLLLGHVSVDTTNIYLLDEVKEAIKTAKRLQDLERAV